MALPTLESIGSFSDAPYDSEAPWSVRRCTEDDLYAEDLFGDEPEAFKLHAGSLKHADDLDLLADGCAYYVIDGSFEVDGILNLKIWDEYNPIAITGNLVAKAVLLHPGAHLYVLGQTRISGPLVSDLGDQGGFYAHGGFEAQVVFDTGRLPPKLGPHSVNAGALHDRYSINQCPNPLDKVLEDLRTGKSLTES